jgi:hypothetical protein
VEGSGGEEKGEELVKFGIRMEERTSKSRGPRIS